MQRIIIVGCSGSGKTSLGIDLSKRLNIPTFDLDDYRWLSNWQHRNKLDFYTVVAKLIDQPSWIVSGNIADLGELILQQCDTIIWLDYSIYRCLIQTFWGCIKRIIFKIPCCNNNYEGFNRTFCSKDSILLWVLKSYSAKRIYYNNYFNNQSAGKTYLRFTEPKLTNNWLKRALS